MTTHDSATRALPERPDLRHLKNQARDLVSAGAASKLSEGQFQIARSYGFASWPKLKAHVDSLTEIGQLKDAIDRDDYETVVRMMTANPSLHRAPLGYRQNGPLTWAAECRIPGGPPSEARLAICRWMIAHGSDVHQGGDGPLMRAALHDDRIPMMELLVAHGADVNARWDGRYPIVLAPCETLAPKSLRWLLAHGADPFPNREPRRADERRRIGSGNPIDMLVGTYYRDPGGRHACLEVLSELGIDFPDTPIAAFHRGRLDLLAGHLQRDSSLIGRRFSLAEIYPPELGFDDPAEGLHVTPVAGATLLHLAIEYDDLETAEWLVDRGADVNARSDVDADGFGGHTPLFHGVVTLGTRDDGKARFLLDRGADPNVRCSLRKQLRHMGDPAAEKLEEYRDVTPTSWARRFIVPEWVSEPALRAVEEHGGRD